MSSPDPRLIVSHPAPLNAEARRFPGRIDPFPADSIFGLAAALGGTHQPPVETPGRYAE